jgi:predicted ester cyclase
MSREENITTVRRYRLEYVGEGNLAVADEILPGEFVLNGERTDLESHKQMVSLWHAAFPDLRLTIEDMIAEGDRVVERFTARGTHMGDLLGIPPTGRQIEGVGILIHRIVEGRIVEIWEVLDMLGLLEQLGITLPAGGDEG